MDALLDRPLPLGSWIRFSPVEVEGDGESAHLIGHIPRSSQMLASDDRLLDDFVRLGSADIAGIRAYAHAHGLFVLCSEHDLPVSAEVREVGHHNCSPARRDDGAVVEPVAFWRALADYAAGVLVLAAAVHDGRELTRDEAPLVRLRRRPTAVEPVLWQRLQLIERVNRWLLQARAVPQIAMSEEGPLNLHLAPSGLYGALGVALLYATTASEGIALCSSCGRPYPPKRRPRPGENHFCPSCGERAAARLRQQRRRRKEK